MRRGSYWLAERGPATFPRLEREIFPWSEPGIVRGMDRDSSPKVPLFLGLPWSHCARLTKIVLASDD
jgi:hypothetical protein